MLQFVIGAAVGAAAVIVKDKYKENEVEQNLIVKQRELDNLSMEKEKISNRNNEMERQVENLLNENKKLRNQYKERDDHYDDLEDKLQDALKEIRKLRVQNEELCRNLEEYKMACRNYEVEVKRLKERE